MKLRPRLSYANVVSTLCLFVLLGGGAYAATQLPKNSIGTKQLKNSAVTSAKIKDGAVTGSKVDLGTLGTVPGAASADTATTAGSAGTAAHATEADQAAHATDSDRLGGELPAAFFRSADVKPFRFFANYCVTPTTNASCTGAPLLKIEETELETTCQFTGGEGQLQVTLTTNNAYSLSYNLHEGSSNVPVESFGGSAFNQHVITLKAAPFSGKSAGGTLVLDNNNSPISINFLLLASANGSSEGNCDFTGTAFHAA